ncbi:MAG: hypothetical protein HYV09_07410 [Deltaproteobacteria bacterium]|nr:hypothetical protein [Deltaproteobacteria bacterium]
MSALRRWIARVAVPFVVPFVLGGLTWVAWAANGDNPAVQAQQVLAELEAMRAGPALSGPPADGGADGVAAPAPVSMPALDAAAHAIGESKKALSRAGELRNVGDVARAEVAEDAALEWALAARDLVKGIELERKADEQAAAATSASSKATRARTLLEESIAKRAKLQQELDALDKEAEARALDAGPADAGKPNKKGGAK